MLSTVQRLQQRQVDSIRLGLSRSKGLLAFHLFDFIRGGTKLLLFGAICDTYEARPASVNLTVQVGTQQST